MRIVKSETNLKNILLKNAVSRKSVYIRIYIFDLLKQSSKLFIIFHKILYEKFRLNLHTNINLYVKL